MQIYATRIAQETPPQYPITLEYIPAFLAHNLIHLRVKEKALHDLTSSKIFSLTLGPPNELILSALIALVPHLRKILFSSLRSSMPNVSGILSRAILAYKRSISIPFRTSLMHGVIAFGTQTTFLTSFFDSRILGKSLKKLYFLLMLHGVTTKTSMSELGELTPSRYDPNGKILNPHLSTSFFGLFLCLPHS